MMFVHPVQRPACTAFSVFAGDKAPREKLLSRTRQQVRKPCRRQDKSTASMVWSAGTQLAPFNAGIVCAPCAHRNALMSTTRWNALQSPVRDQASNSKVVNPPVAGRVAVWYLVPGVFR